VFNIFTADYKKHCWCYSQSG